MKIPEIYYQLPVFVHGDFGVNSNNFGINSSCCMGCFETNAPTKMHLCKECRLKLCDVCVIKVDHRLKCHDCISLSELEAELKQTST